jgi:hypothetical protein
VCGASGGGSVQTDLKSGEGVRWRRMTSAVEATLCSCIVQRRWWRRAQWSWRRSAPACGVGGCRVRCGGVGIAGGGGGGVIALVGGGRVRGGGSGVAGGCGGGQACSAAGRV